MTAVGSRMRVVFLIILERWIECVVLNVKVSGEDDMRVKGDFIPLFWIGLGQSIKPMGLVICVSPILSPSKDLSVSSSTISVVSSTYVIKSPKFVMTYS